VNTFDNRVVLVTGACGGIGSAIARAFASEGACLALCDLRDDDVGRLAGELRDGGHTVVADAFDVADEAAVRAFCAGVGEQLGRLDAIINTVGILDEMGDVVELETARWKRCIDVNLTSAFLTAKYGVPLMQDGGGAIVNVASVSGYANQADAMVYSVTKAGLLALTRSEAIDLAGHGIRAVAICPGSVSTPLIDRAAELTAERTGGSKEEQLREWMSQYPSGRFSTPKEIADLALFLCSDKARNITGTGVVIDGGLTALLPER
jgi:3-hydroxybutyrate dehydrogenase